MSLHRTIFNKLWPIEQEILPFITHNPCCTLLISLAPQPTADKFATNVRGVWGTVGIVMMLMMGVVKLDPEYSLTFDNLPPTTCDYDVTHL